MKHYELLLSLFLVSCATMVTEMPETTITTQRTHELMQSDTSVVILDVRRMDEFTSESGHLAGAILIPVQELEARVNELEPYKDKTIIAVCRSGNRSGRATMFLNGKGFKVMNMLGGMIQWNDERLPVVHEKR